MRFSPRHAPVLFGLIVSGIQTCIVSAVSVAAGMSPVFDGFFLRWMGAWATSWAVAFPLLTLLAPRVGGFVARITAPPSPIAGS